jgi:HKD family nuclease
MQVIRQAITKESLFFELQDWCKKGAGQTRDRFLIMSAFATGSGVKALEPFFDIFLSDGNSIEVVIGIDRNGTNREAVARLFALQESYVGQFSCHVFHAPSNTGIFHPKLYVHRSPRSVSAIVGSANLTLGGLGNNFESLFSYREIPIRSKVAHQLMDAWSTYSVPKSPLKSEFLRKLTRRYTRRLLHELPATSSIESERANKGVKSVWASVSSVKLPRSNERIQTPRNIARTPVNAFLLIDILTETRSTQVQLPLAVVEKFFRLAKDQIVPQGVVYESWILARFTRAQLTTADNRAG